MRDELLALAHQARIPAKDWGDAIALAHSDGCDDYWVPLVAGLTSYQGAVASSAQRAFAQFQQVDAARLHIVMAVRHLAAQSDVALDRDPSGIWHGRTVDGSGSSYTVDHQVSRAIALFGEVRAMLDVVSFSHFIGRTFWSRIGAGWKGSRERHWQRPDDPATRDVPHAQLDLVRRAWLGLTLPPANEQEFRWSPAAEPRLDLEDAIRALELGLLRRRREDIPVVAARARPLNPDATDVAAAAALERWHALWSDEKKAARLSVPRPLLATDDWLDRPRVIATCLDRLAAKQGRSKIEHARLLALRDESALAGALRLLDDAWQHGWFDDSDRYIDLAEAVYPRSDAVRWFVEAFPFGFTDDQWATWARAGFLPARRKLQLRLRGYIRSACALKLEADGSAIPDGDNRYWWDALVAAIEPELLPHFVDERERRFIELCVEHRLEDVARGGDWDTRWRAGGRDALVAGLRALGMHEAASRLLDSEDYRRNAAVHEPRALLEWSAWMPEDPRVASLAARGLEGRNPSFEAAVAWRRCQRRAAGAESVGAPRE